MSSKIHADYNKVVTKKDLTKVFLREITYEHTWNYERMGNVGFCFSMYPVLKKLYPDKKDLAAAMKRHLTLYQTSHYLATFQMGITAAMEEENAQDADFDTDSIGAVKTALMGPIAGIGDSLFWGTIKVIATGIGCSLALQGNILGPILFLLIFNIPAYLCRWFGVFLGYKMGRESMAKIVESFSYNPFLYIAGPCIIYLIVRGDLNYIKRDTYRLGTVDTVLIYILIVAALIFGVVRNL